MTVCKHIAQRVVQGKISGDLAQQDSVMVIRGLYVEGGCNFRGETTVKVRVLDVVEPCAGLWLTTCAALMHVLLRRILL